MSDELKRRQEQREKLAADIRKLADKANGEEGWNDSDREAWEKANTAYDENLKALQAEQKAEDERLSIASRVEQLEQYQDANPIRDRIGRTMDEVEDREREDEPQNGRDRGPSNDDLVHGIQGWLRAADPGEYGPVTSRHLEAAKRCGVSLGAKAMHIRLDRDWRTTKRNALQSFRNALSAEDGAAGGYTFGETFIGRLETAMLAFGGMFQVAEVIRTATGEPMRWPTADDTGNTGEQIGENTAVNEQDVAFAQVLWNAYKFSSKMIKVPSELLRDSAFNLADVLAGMLGERLGRIQNTKYTTGNGASTPKGIVTAATAGVTAASATAIAFDELIDLEHSLDPSRRRLPGVGYMFHDSVLKALRKLKDGEGRYLWQAGANSGAPDTLNTYPYTVNQDMASSIAADNATVLFGQLSQYKIRQVSSIRMLRLDERFADSDQVAFLAFISGDGNLLDAGDGPVRKLTQASS